MNHIFAVCNISPRRATRKYAAIIRRLTYVDVTRQLTPRSRQSDSRIDTTELFETRSLF